MPKAPQPSNTGDSLLDALNNSIAVSNVAYLKFVQASEANSPQLSARLSDHSRAVDARLKAEKAYTDEQERRGTLVDKAEVLQTARQSVEAVLRRLKRLPNEVGPQCNPENPLLATKILAREIAAVISTGAKEVHGIRSGAKS